MSGAELTRRLRESGTGRDKLDVCRRVLADTPGASAAAVENALERHVAHFGLEEAWAGTLAKVRRLMAGDVAADQPPGPAPNPEDVILQHAEATERARADGSALVDAGGKPLDGPPLDPPLSAGVVPPVVPPAGTPKKK